jgi:flagellar basal body-associated protein FliL
MADEAKKKEADKSPAGEKAGEKKEGGKGGAGGMLAKTPVLIGGVMIIEAAVLFAGFKFLGGTPHVASGADFTTTDESTTADGKTNPEGAKPGEGTATPAADKKEVVELKILDGRFPNKQTGRVFLYDVTIFAVTQASEQERVAATIKQREALITDRVRTIIAQSDPEKLGGGSEPGLETLRRQVKYRLDEIIGEDVIQEVLVPRCIPLRTDF